MIYQIHKKYSWDMRGYKVSADIVGAEMERIEKEHGEVTSALLLEDARPEDSPIHALFDWNNDSAAEKYRMLQAGRIIRAINVQIIRIPQETKVVDVSIKKSEPQEQHTEQISMRKSPDNFVAPIRAFVNVANSNHQKFGNNQGRFVNVTSAMGDSEKRKQVLLNALDELHQFQKKYADYCEFASLFADIRRIEAEINASTEERAVANG